MKNLFSGRNDALAAAGAASGEGLSMVQLGKGLVLSCVLLAVGSLILAAAYCYTSLAGSTAHLLQLLVLAAASFAGGFSAARGAGHKGLWHGLALAVLLLVLLLAANLAGLTSAGAEGVAGLAVLVKGLALCLAGGLGGIIGVN